MKILLLGATGNVGKVVLRVLVSLAPGKVDVVVLVRDPTKLVLPKKENEDGKDVEKLLSSIRVVKGDVSDAAALKPLMDDCEVCIGAMGRPDDGKDGQPSSLEVLFQVVFDVAKSTKNPPRLLMMGGLGVMTAPGGSFVYSLPGFPAVAKAYSTIHEKNWIILRHSSLDWTLFCPSFMTEEETDKKVVTSVEHAPFYDPDSGGGKFLSSMPSFFSTLTLAGGKKKLEIPYMAVANVIVETATGAHPEFNKKRIGFSFQ